MAIDNATKRKAAFNFGFAFPLVLPDADGAIDAEDRALLMVCYTPINTLTFDQAAVATVRKPLARVTIQWGGGALDSLAVVSTTQNSIHDRVPFLINQLADRNTVIPVKYFCMDNRTPIDQMRMAPSTLVSAAANQFGWWGDGISDGAGNFAVTQSVAVSFSSGPLNTLQVVGDAAYNEYPVDFVVKVFSGALLSHTETVYGNAALDWSAAITNVPSATRTTIEITKWSAADTCCKLAEFFTSISEVYDGDEIMSLSVLEEMEIKDATIPTGNISANELELALNNVDDKFFPANTSASLHSAVRKGRRITVEIGFDVPGVGATYKPMGTFWSGDWKVAEGSTVALTVARDRMERLRKANVEPSEIYYRETIGELAERLLIAALGTMPDLTYSIDAALYDSKYAVPVAWFAKGSYFDALKDLARACLGRTFCDRNDVVQVLGPVEFGAYSYEITADNYFDRTQPEDSSDVANVVIVTTQPLTPAVGEEIYTSSEYEMLLGEIKEYVFEFSDAPCKDQSGALTAVANQSDGLVTFTGAISAPTYTAWGGTVTATCTTAGTMTIGITGTKYTSVGADLITRESADSIFEYGENAYALKKNAFLQSPDLAEEIANGLLANFKDPGKDIVLDWRGNPSIGLETIVRAPEYVRGAVNNKADFVVYKQKTEWDGTLKATLSGKKIRATVNAVMQDVDGSAYVMQDTDGSVPALILQG